MIYKKQLKFISRTPYNIMWSASKKATHDMVNENGQKETIASLKSLTNTWDKETKDSNTRWWNVWITSNDGVYTGCYGVQGFKMTSVSLGFGNLSLFGNWRKTFQCFKWHMQTIMCAQRSFLVVPTVGYVKDYSHNAYSGCMVAPTKIYPCPNLWNLWM